jgi:hypothetical protein
MTKASNEAARIAGFYFARRGEATPQVQAESFLSRILISSDGRWRSQDLVDTGSRILAAAIIDVDDLVENHLGISLFVESLGSYDFIAGAPVFGLADPQRYVIKICERAERYQPLYRATVAHELGHIALHGPGLHNRVLTYAPQSKIRPPEEREADQFMIALIAPPSILKLAIALAAHQSELHVADVFRRANATWGRDRWRHAIFPRLIDRMCLSRELLAVQMSKWGFLEQSTLDYHKSYPLPNRWRNR